MSDLRMSDLKQAPEKPSAGNISDCFNQLIALELVQLQIQLQIQQALQKKPAARSIANSVKHPTVESKDTKLEVVSESGKKSDPDLCATLLIRWTLTDSFGDSEKEAVMIPLATSVTTLKMILERESGFIRRYCNEHKTDRWDWSEFDITLGELGYATLLPSFRFTRAEHIVDIFPRQRMALRFLNDHGIIQWLFESPAARARREAAEESEMRREAVRQQLEHRQLNPLPQQNHQLDRGSTAE